MEFIKVQFKNDQKEIEICETMDELEDNFPIAIREFLGNMTLEEFLEFFDSWPEESLKPGSDVMTRIVDYCDPDLCFSVQKIPVSAIDPDEKGLFTSSIVERAYVKDKEEYYALDCMYSG